MRLFITGASGFIGGAIATRLVSEGHEVRGLIRDENKAAELRKFGIIPIIGTLDDSALLTKEAKNSEGVINAASSDHRGAVEALIKGLEGSNKPFLHTSGSSIVGDEAMGEASERIYHEDDVIVPEPDKIARVALDQFVLNAKGVRSVVLCNTMIYGDAIGPQAQSVQIPRLAKLAKDTGVARFIGKGMNRWSNVHIEDVASLYSLALLRAKAGTFLYVESGEEAFLEIARSIADRYKLGPAQSMNAEEANRVWGREMAVFALGSNSRVRGTIAKSLGWKPKHLSVTDWIRSELP